MDIWWGKVSDKFGLSPRPWQVWAVTAVNLAVVVLLISILALPIAINDVLPWEGDGFGGLIAILVLLPVFVFFIYMFLVSIDRFFRGRRSGVWMLATFHLVLGTFFLPAYFFTFLASLSPIHLALLVGALLYWLSTFFVISLRNLPFFQQEREVGSVSDGDVKSAESTSSDNFSISNSQVQIKFSISSDKIVRAIIFFIPLAIVFIAFAVSYFLNGPVSASTEELFWFVVVTGVLFMVGSSFASEFFAASVLALLVGFFIFIFSEGNLFLAVPLTVVFLILPLWLSKKIAGHRKRNACCHFVNKGDVKLLGAITAFLLATVSSVGVLFSVKDFVEYKKRENLRNLVLTSHSSGRSSLATLMNEAECVLAEPAQTAYKRNETAVIFINDACNSYRKVNVVENRGGKIVSIADEYGANIRVKRASETATNAIVSFPLSRFSPGSKELYITAISKGRIIRSKPIVILVE